MLIAWAALDAAAAPATPDDAMGELLRHLQIESWVGTPVPLADGLCAQHALLAQGNWPRAEPPSDRQLERVHQSLEACSRASAAAELAGKDRGLLASAQEDFRARLRRLEELRQRLQVCEVEQKSHTDQCQKAVAGRVLADQEQLLLRRRGGSQ